MVICTTESVPHPPAPPPMGFLAKNGSTRSRRSGFRLVEQQDDTCSVYSVYKQKIDSMFESDSSAKTQNSVQVRIEKMFTEVVRDNGFPVSEIGCYTFSVDYLGSVPLEEKVTSLSGLQNPLRELYFSYKKNGRHKATPSGRLEISPNGLKVLYQKEKGDLEQLNSFPTIAVWSAVKFVLQDDTNSCAFLPLITDPDSIDKQQLFQNLNADQQKYIVRETSHSPIFAVVMRKIGVQKQLECHGFICQTSEDAIVIAATLYKSLMAHMKAKEKVPKNRNGVTCMSIASSVCNESSAPTRPPRKKKSTTSSVKSPTGTMDVNVTKSTHEKSEQLYQSSGASNVPTNSSQSHADLDAILPYEEPDVVKQVLETEITEIKPHPLNEKWNTYRSSHQKQITAEIKQVMTESTNMGLKRVKSVRKRNEDGIVKGKENSGDILTKVTIPRSGSFLNAGGLTKYKSKIHRYNGQATGGSPLGFSELFNEFRLQEGLHSVDDILGVIIDPEGMSFNDLKPIYKEFLLKLALTLTKDELYQRSKLIMRRQRKKLMRAESVAGKRRHIIVYKKFKRLKHIFQKIKLVKIIQNKPANLPTFASKPKDKLPESTISSSSYDTRQFRPKVTQVVRKPSYRKRNLKRVDKGGVSTSEESDFFSMKRKVKENGGNNSNNNGSNQNRNSSSGYVSCSECSYDSESCTCVSADKCYCSLGNKSFEGKHPRAGRKPGDNTCYCVSGKKDFIWCGCDTDSCTDSNKCYCSGKRNAKGSIFEQLQKRGFIPGTEQPPTTTPPNHRKLCKSISNSKSTKSLEYFHNPTEGYYEKLRPQSRMGYVSEKNNRHSENLRLDYDLFTIANENRVVYGRALSEVENTKTKQSSVRSTFSSYSHKGRSFHSTAAPVGACTEALSVKKSAEIAALFADVKLSQTTDVAHLVPRHRDMNSLIARKNALNTKRPPFPRPGKLDDSPQTHLNKMILNSLYSSRNNLARANMYSARNGLYTIQSQSDDSRSSVGRRSKSKDESGAEAAGEKKPVSGLENSLGKMGGKAVFLRETKGG